MQFTLQINGCIEKKKKKACENSKKDVTVQKLRNTEYLAMIGRGIA